MSAWDLSENSNFVVFVAQIDVCRVRPWVIGRAPMSLRVEGMLGKHVGTVEVRREGAGGCALNVSENSNFVVFLAKIDVCRVRPWVIGRAPLTQGVVVMLGEQFGTAGGRGGGVGVCVLGVSQHISRF